MVPCMSIGVATAEAFRLDWPRKLERRSLAGVRLVISNAHDGIEATTPRVLQAT
jgi:transposase-like protein